jgi:NAD(P)-dependent dehydrogenase (short-subunit alcohol dehydrogenase family)
MLMAESSRSSGKGVTPCSCTLKLTGFFNSLDRAHMQMETNFFGVIRAMKAVLPAMRTRESGVIVNVSSAEFWVPHPIASVYAASKFALEGKSPESPPTTLFHV